MGPSVEVSCPKCGRMRKVRRGTVVASMVGHTTHNALQWLMCITCKCLRSIAQHQAAIRALDAKVSERRFKGL